MKTKPPLRRKSKTPPFWILRGMVTWEHWHNGESGRADLKTIGYGKRRRDAIEDVRVAQARVHRSCTVTFGEISEETGPHEA